MTAIFENMKMGEYSADIEGLDLLVGDMEAAGNFISTPSGYEFEKIGAYDDEHRTHFDQVTILV